MSSMRLGSRGEAALTDVGFLQLGGKELQR
jgi:hypothetical protein